MKISNILVSAGFVAMTTVGAYVLLSSGKPTDKSSISDSPNLLKGSTSSNPSFHESGSPQETVSRVGASEETPEIDLVAFKGELSSIKDDLASLKKQVQEMVVALNTYRAQNTKIYAGEAVEAPEREEAEYSHGNPGERPESIEILFEKQESDVDIAWSAHAGEVLYDAFDNGLPAGTSLLDVQCRSTVCRTTVQHEDSTTWADLLQALPVAVMETFSTIAIASLEEGVDDTSRVIYFARDGTMD